MSTEPWAHLVHGDCLDVLRRMRAASIDAVTTDPPYDLVGNSRNGSSQPGDLNSPRGRSGPSKARGFMGKEWDGTGIAFRPETWAEVLRVLRPGGYLLAFGGARTYHRMACAIEDAGFTVRDSLHWVYASGMPKSLDIGKALDKAAGAERTEVIGPRPGHEDMIHRTDMNAGGGRTEGWDRPWKGDPQKVAASHLRMTPATDLAAQWDGWGTALKPSHEPIVLAQKPLTGTYAANVTRWGMGALNIGATRTEYQSDADRNSATPQGKATSKVGALAGGTQNDNERTEFERPALLGRWPANFLLSHSPDCTEEDCDADCPVVALDTQSGNRKSGAMSGVYKGFGTRGILGEGGHSPRHAEASEGGASRFFPVFRYCAKTSRSERGEGNNHPTVKPTSLMRWLARLVTPPGGIVLDPFLGSGSTGVACAAEGFNFIGIEREADYYAIANIRIFGAEEQEAAD